MKLKIEAIVAIGDRPQQPTLVKTKTVVVQPDESFESVLNKTILVCSAGTAAEWRCRLNSGNYLNHLDLRTGVK